MLMIDSGQVPELLIVSSSSANEPRQTSPKLPPSAMAVAMTPVPCRPVAATSTNGAVGSLLMIRIVAVSVTPAVVGVKLTVKSTSSPGADGHGVAGVGSTVKSVEPNSRSTLVITRSARRRCRR